VTELEKIFLTSALTVVGASLVFALQRFVIEPLNEQSKVLGRITYSVYYYGREFSFPVNPENTDADTQRRYWAAADQFRALAETSQAIRLYWLCMLLRLTPRRKRIHEAIGLLTRISNSFFAFDVENRTQYARQNHADADMVLEVLKLHKWGK